MEKRLLSHTAYKTEYHVTWVTKYRLPVLNPTKRKYLAQLLPKILLKMPGCEMVELKILRSHIHMVLVIPPKYSVSKVIGRIKGRTSGHLRKSFPRLAGVYWKENIVWSPGYFVSTVGIGEDKILSYVRSQ